MQSRSQPHKAHPFPYTHSEQAQQGLEKQLHSYYHQNRAKHQKISSAKDTEAYSQKTIERC